MNKIKKEHSIAEGLTEILIQLEILDCVHRIIPGKIVRQGRANNSYFRANYKTRTGIKATFKHGTQIQEVHIITNDRSLVLDWINNYNYS